MARKLFTSESVTEGHPDKNMRSNIRCGSGRYIGKGSRCQGGL